MARRLLLALALGLLAPASAAAAPLSLSAFSPGPGVVSLQVTGTAGTEVTFREGSRVLGRETLASDTEVWVRAAEWNCTTHRTFSVTDGTATASASVDTPSCRTRLALIAPPSLRAGRVARLQVRDTWGLPGYAARLCVRPPGRREGCRRVTAGRAEQRLWRKGAWRFVIRTPQGAGRVHVVRVRRIAHLRVLAAGDSMIQIVDDFMRARLRPGGAAVRFDDHISTGLTKPFLLDWPRHAAAVSRSYRPDVTVMFIGANDGFPIGGASCCGAAWVRAYAATARGIMRSYARDGAGRVYWLTLPRPRGGAFARIFPAVNRALRRAARGLPTARVLDLGPTITPRGAYRPAVRQSDGVHLNVRGASLVAGLVVRALRADGLL